MEKVVYVEEKKDDKQGFLYGINKWLGLGQDVCVCVCLSYGGHIF